MFRRYESNYSSFGAIVTYEIPLVYILIDGGVMDMVI